MLASQIIDLDFMESVENIPLRPKKKTGTAPIIGDFKAYLEAEKVSPNTIKSYLSDIRQFMSWLETNNQSQITNH
jgi:site-specific recombinase XerC